MARSPHLIVQFEFSHKNLTRERRDSLEQSIAELHQLGFHLHSRDGETHLDRL